ncbi:MAG: amidohydrolase family protein [Variibacter sp.]|nr:amidohydrolase family protein [Variibacter sp.]
MHIYDAVRYPPARPASRMQSDAGVAEYRLLQRRLGTARTVVVTPAAYVTDNRVTLDAIEALGREQTRGVAVVHPDVTDQALRTLAAGGIRGIRFTVFDPRTAAVSVDMIEPLAARAADLGWHVQIHMRGDQIVAHAALLRRLPATLVFDHMGRLPLPAGPAHPAFGVIAELLEQGRAWVKLSGAYMDTQVGPPSYADKAATARAFIAVAPDRMLWGSDWPHPTEQEKPDDATLLDLLGAWAGDDDTRRRILVYNPAALYGF